MAIWDPYTRLYRFSTAVAVAERNMHFSFSPAVFESLVSNKYERIQVDSQQLFLFLRRVANQIAEMKGFRLLLPKGQ